MHLDRKCVFFLSYKLIRFVLYVFNLCDGISYSCTSLCCWIGAHYSDVIMSAAASLITGVSMVWLIVWLGADQRKHHSSGSQVFARGIHRWPMNSPHKGPVMRKRFPFDDVIIANFKGYFLAGFCCVEKQILLLTGRSWTKCHWLNKIISQ